jgi:hypothetical protein
MILVRDIFQAKYGQGDELVSLFKEAQRQWSPYAGRILTDLSGSFFTVVVETEVENLGQWESAVSNIFSKSEFGDWFGRMQRLVESGSREFYRIEA